MSHSQNRWQPANQMPCRPDLAGEQLETQPEKQNSLSAVSTHRVFDLLPTSISALSEMKQQVQSSSLTKIIQCCTTDKRAISYLKELNASEIKESILHHIVKDLEHQKTRLNARKGSLWEGLRAEVETTNLKDTIKKAAQDYLCELVQKVSTYLRKKQNHKFVYKFIHFQWTSAIFQLFFNAIDQEGSQRIKHKSESAEEKGKQILKPISETKQIGQERVLQSELISNDVITLLNQISDKVVARKLYSSFYCLTQDICKKQSQLESSKKQTQELATLLARQMSVIQQINIQNHKFHHQIMVNTSEFQTLKNRCEGLERELVSALESLCVLQKQKKQQYYLNPFWDKSKLQEKYMSEIIQLQSDIYLERIQTKSLVDLIIQQIKMTHKAFYDLGSSSYFVSKFDRLLSQKLKMLKAFDSVNLDECLLLKEESLLQESDYTHDMHKSTISTYSSIEMEHKYPMLVEESFDNFNQNND